MVSETNLIYSYPSSTIYHQTINGKYRIVFEQAASAKGVLGFKVEVNGDDQETVKSEAEVFLTWAKNIAPSNNESKEVKQ